MLAFGLVSLAADMVYEGMRAVSGPFLGQLGASALTVALVTGAGEAVALVLRLATGPWADRSRRHWQLTVAGYTTTALCVPLLALAPFLGAAGVSVAATLILLERVGKAVRSPSKSTLLARMATRTGQGKGFAVHKALDQVGAFAGPLLLAGTAAVTGVLWPGFALLAVPGVLSLLLLAQLRRRVPSLARPDPEDDTEDDAGPLAPRSGSRGQGLWAGVRAALGVELPPTFHLFSLAVALSTAGLMTFGVISYRFVDAGLVGLAAVPLVYALAMAVQAVAALATGTVFDRVGPRVLLVVPPLVALVPVVVFADRLALVLLGVVAWGVATGIQDSTVKAHVAGLVRPQRRATAYGVLAAVQGLGALGGAVLAGLLVTDHVAVLAGCIGALQMAALVLLLRTCPGRAAPPGATRSTRPRGRPAGG